MTCYGSTERKADGSIVVSSTGRSTVTRTDSDIILARSESGWFYSASFYWCRRAFSYGTEVP